MTKKVLLIEDDPKTARFICASLQEAGFAVDCAYNGIDGLNLARSGAHHCIVLDRLMEGVEGLTLLRTLRGEGCDIPVLILSAIGSTDERVRGLRAGADDYLTKPFASAELLARIESVLRRKSPDGPAQARLSCDDLRMDLMTGQVSRAGQPLSLSPRGSQLLAFFLRHKGEVVTRRMILEQVWHYDFDPGTNVIDVHVSNLRRSIDMPGLPRLLHTIRGLGYRLCDQRDDA
ncbi:response regulator transcription factor [Novosphingobium sp.]|uniref:response regulator transcription factor n=1 Tax=Novosphingobium sp. TaxID=1874826 RepID=UPI00273744AB|nr:response regulator transcription factor [Novosphingobium sp.]MDP3908557.1 response regulator transcription factor [Novosphingobium sp.]